MREIIFAKTCHEDDRPAIISTFKRFEEKYANMMDMMQTEVPDIKLDCLCVPNYACGWNRPQMMGKNCIVIAQKDQLSIVIFEDNSSGIYRNEDLTFIKQLGNGTTQTTSNPA